MKIAFSRLALVAAIALTASAPTQARDARLRFPIADAVTAGGTKINPEVKLYWGDQKFPSAAKLQNTLSTNKKTNFFNKSDKEGCEWAFLSAVIALQQAATKAGANAVVNIHSVYRDGDLSSETEYECGAGSVVGGVALRGTIAMVP